MTTGYPVKCGFRRNLVKFFFFLNKISHSCEGIVSKSNRLLLRYNEYNPHDYSILMALCQTKESKYQFYRTLLTIFIMILLSLRQEPIRRLKISLYFPKQERPSWKISIRKSNTRAQRPNSGIRHHYRSGYSLILFSRFINQIRLRIQNKAWLLTRLELTSYF